jgi:hypothetical protein
MIHFGGINHPEAEFDFGHSFRVGRESIEQRHASHRESAGRALNIL